MLKDLDSNLLHTLAQEAITKAAKSSGTSLNPPRETTSSEGNDQTSIEYVAKSDTLLATKGNYLKLLYRQPGGFSSQSALFSNLPRNPKDEVTLTVSKADIATLLSQG